MKCKLHYTYLITRLIGYTEYTMSFSCSNILPDPAGFLNTTVFSNRKNAPPAPTKKRTYDVFANDNVVCSTSIGREEELKLNIMLDVCLKDICFYEVHDLHLHVDGIFLWMLALPVLHGTSIWKLRLQSVNVCFEEVMEIGTLHEYTSFGEFADIVHLLLETWRKQFSVLSTFKMYVDRTDGESRLIIQHFVNE